MMNRSPEKPSRPRETSWGIIGALAGVAGVIVAIITIFLPHDDTTSSATRSASPTATASPAEAPPLVPGIHWAGKKTFSEGQQVDLDNYLDTIPFSTTEVS